MSENTIKSLSELGSKMNFEVKYPQPRRGEFYKVDLSDMAIGTVHIISKARPAIILSNNVGNLYSDTVIVSFLTTTAKKYILCNINLI